MFHEKPLILQLLTGFSRGKAGMHKYCIMVSGKVQYASWLIYSRQKQALTPPPIRGIHKATIQYRFLH
ncbi:MAG: hypothetical protein K1W21_08040, partial [Oscillospiraceae bacterium]